MTLTRPSIRKLFREHFPGHEPLHVAAGERKAIAAALLRPFEGDPWVDTRVSWVAPENRDRYLHSFTLKDPDRGYYAEDLFHLMLDDRRRLLIKLSYGSLSAPVSSGEEIVAFVRECKRRLERRRALAKRREKVRGFRRAAMVAQLKEIAREQQFEFYTESSPVRVKLWIKLNEQQDAVEIHFRPKRYQEILPRLPEVIRSLKESYRAGVSFKVVTRRALPWGAEWIGAGDPNGVGS